MARDMHRKKLTIQKEISNFKEYISIEQKKLFKSRNILTIHYKTTHALIYRYEEKMAPSATIKMSDIKYSLVCEALCIL